MVIYSISKSSNVYIALGGSVRLVLEGYLYMQHQGFLQTHPGWSSLHVNAAQSAEYLRALIEHSPIAIVVLDAGHHYTLCNAAFQKLFQYSSEELAKSNIDSLIAAPSLVEEAADLTRSVLRGEKVHTVTQRRRKDGMIVDVELHGVPLFVEDELAGVYGLYQDVTERNRTRNAFRNITHKLENLQQEERRRIARDLHDSTSQELAVLNWNLRRLTQLVANGDEAVKDLVRQTKDLAYECSERIRSTSYLLHPPLLDHGLAPAIAELAAGFEQRSGVRVDLTLSRTLGRLSNEQEVALYRIVQEGLANVLRHSGSPVVHILLQEQSNWLKLTLADEGNGCEDETVSIRRHGTGIKGMRERLEQLGGLLTVCYASTGTTITADLPLESTFHA
jgi:two-component system NarL family sensor kinase